MTDQRPWDLTRISLSVLLIGAMLSAAYTILRPFLAPLVWAALLTIACWPLLLRLQRWLGNRRWLAVTALMVTLLLLFVVPMTLILGVLINRAPDLADWARQWVDRGVPPPPPWVADLPMVGARIAKTWGELAAEGPTGLSSRVAPHADELARWFVAQAGSAGVLFFHFLVTMVLAGFLLAKGELIGGAVRRFAFRLAGERGDRAAVLAANGVRAVAIGVVVTALVQALAGGLGLLVAGVPVAGLLTAVMFVSSLAQIGAAPVLALAAVWLFVQGSTGWGVGMIGWTLLVGSLDNVIRPLVIQKGLDLPLLLLFIGVVGGLVAFGPVGLFIGPVVLAVGYTLINAWVAEVPAASVTAGGSSAL